MPNTSTYKTPQQLLTDLMDHTKKATPNEMREQRVSFVYGSISDESAVTREQIREVLAKQQAS